MDDEPTRLVTNSAQGLSLTTVKLEMFCASISIGCGTGFIERFGDERYLVTNWHNVTGRQPSNGRTKSMDGITPDKVRVHSHFNAPPPLPTGAHSAAKLYFDIPIAWGEGSVWKMHPVGQKVDIVATPFQLPYLNFNVSDFSLQQTFEINVADNLVILGFPKGLSPTGTLPLWKSAMVATEPTHLAFGEPCFLIDAATREGMSGSPVFKRLPGSHPLRPPNADRDRLTPQLTVSFLTGFVGIYSGRFGVTDLLEAQLG